MNKPSIFLKHPELKEFFYLIRYEIQQAQRPADEIILDDEDVMRHLKISKRKLQYLKADKSSQYIFLILVAPAPIIC